MKSQQTAAQVYASMQSRQGKRTKAPRVLPSANYILAMLAAFSVSSQYAELETAGDADKTNSARFDRFCKALWPKRNKLATIDVDTFNVKLGNKLLDLAASTNANGSAKHPNVITFGLTPRHVTVDSLVGEFGGYAESEESEESATETL